MESVEENNLSHKRESVPSISVTIRYFAILREQRGIAEEVILTTASTPLELYDELLTRHGFTLPADRIRVALNDRFDEMDHALKNGDIVVFVPPVAGG